MSRQILIFTPIFLLTMVVGYLYYTQPQQDPPKKITTPLPVSITVAKLQPFQDGIDVIGSILANESVQLSSKVTETVTKINFSEGQLVHKGDIIVELNSEEEQAVLEEAEKQYNRIENLAKTAAATLTKRDQHLLNKQVAQARLNNRKIAAPFSGTLGLRKVSEGTLVNPGTVITSLDDISVVKFEFAVSERRIGLVKIDQIINATAIAYPQETFSGKVYAIDTRVNPATRTMVVKALIPNDRFLLKPGMLLHAKVLLPEEEVLFIPEEAIFAKKGIKEVYLVDEEGVIRCSPVQLGRRIAGCVEVLAGVQPGDRLVMESASSLDNGQKVIVKETKTIESSIAEFNKYKS